MPPALRACEGLELGSRLWGRLGWEKETLARGPLAWPPGRHRRRRTFVEH